LRQTVVKGVSKNRVTSPGESSGAFLCRFDQAAYKIEKTRAIVLIAENAKIKYQHCDVKGESD
jgi:hypothetical protein